VAAVIGPRQVQIELAVREQAELFPELTRRRTGQRSRPPDAANLNPKYTFANFVVGASNQFAHRGLQGGRHPARRPLQPALHLRWGGAR
jgi:chromosomal replication initiation ATPase DnaA